jgi:hypothetical protein
MAKRGANNVVSQGTVAHTRHHKVSLPSLGFEMSIADLPSTFIHVFW